LSRLRSSRASNKSSASRSTATPRQRGVLVQAAKSDIYVALLGIALAAILIACLLMAIILYQYDWAVTVASVFPTARPGAGASQLASVIAEAPFRLTS